MPESARILTLITTVRRTALNTSDFDSPPPPRAIDSGVLTVCGGGVQGGSERCVKTTKWGFFQVLYFPVVK